MCIRDSAWWPLVDAGGVEAIVMNASGCGVTVKEYGHILKDDAAYAAKAERISALTRDLSELLPALLPELATKLQGRVNQPDTLYAYHPPCTLQHGQKLRGGVEVHLNQLASSCAPHATMPTCAVARQAPIRCSTPTCPTSCATASWVCSARPSATSRPT